MASSELLKQIQAGKKLKKTETNDRSGPLIDSKSGSAGAGSRAPASTHASLSGGGPPQLGALFAGGVPKLKPAGHNNLAKPPILGKPPAIPIRAVLSPAPSAPPAPSRAAPPRPLVPAPPLPVAPAPPARPAPALPSRGPAIPLRAPPAPARATPSPPVAAPAPPRRPPPPPRTASPSTQPQAPPTPIRPPPYVSARSASPAEAPSSSTRVPPPPPIRPGNGNPIPPARKAPPPPPARPTSIAGTLPSRVAPPPPARRVPAPDGALIPSAHLRALSEETPAAPLPPGPLPARMSLLPPPAPPLPSSQRLRVVSSPVPSEAPPRPSAVVPTRETNGTRRPAPTRKIPSPPPEAGSHRFPTTDFPPPRMFTPETKLYGGGRQRGSDFDLSNI